MHTKMTIYLQEWAGFVLIPYPMRPGQSPRNILPEYRLQWVPLTSGHSAIPNDVAWYPGCFVEIDAVDVGEAWAEAARIAEERKLAMRRQKLAEEMAGGIWLACESLALELALSANRTGEACVPWQGRAFRLARQGNAAVVFVDGTEQFRHAETMVAARWMVKTITAPGQTQEQTPLAA
jgi:hypothetical protein